MRLMARVLVLCSMAFSGCRINQPKAPEQPAAGDRQRNGASQSDVRFQGFNVAVTLSEKAAQLLEKKKETVIISGYFSGVPNPGAPKHYVSDTGEVELGGELWAEVAPGAGAVFDEVNLKRDALEQTTGDPDLLINVFSGRRSSKDNLLDCNIYDGPLKSVQGKSIPIHCKLIAE